MEKEKFKILLDNQNYQSMIDVYFEQGFNKKHLESSLENCLKAINYRGANDFSKDLLSKIKSLENKNLKEITDYLKLLYSIKEIFLLLPDNEEKTLKKSIQDLELKRYNKLNIWNKNNLIGFDFYYILENINKVDEDKRVSFLKFIAKNINMAAHTYPIETESKISFVNVVLNEVKDKKIANNIVNLFYKNINIKSEVMKKIFLNEINLSFSFILDTLSNDKNKNNEIKNDILISHLLCSEKEINKENLKKFVKTLINKEREIIIKTPTDIFINSENFNNFMNFIQADNIKIKIFGISINDFLGKININELYRYRNNINFSDNLLNNDILLNIEEINEDNVLAYLKKSIDIARIKEPKNINIERKTVFLMPKNNNTFNMKKINTEKKDENLKQIISVLGNENFKNKIEQDLLPENYKYIPSVIISDILDKHLKCYSDFNKFFLLINESIRDEKEKDKIFHIYFWKNFEKAGSTYPYLKEIEKITDMEIIKKILQFVKIDRRDVFDEIYDKSHETLKYSAFSNILNENHNALITKIIPLLEKKLIESNISKISPENKKMKKRL